MTASWCRPSRALTSCTFRFTRCRAVCPVCPRPPVPNTEERWSTSRLKYTASRLRASCVQPTAATARLRVSASAALGSSRLPTAAVSQVHLPARPTKYSIVPPESVSVSLSSPAKTEPVCRFSVYVPRSRSISRGSAFRWWSTAASRAKSWSEGSASRRSSARRARVSCLRRAQTPVSARREGTS